LSGAVARSTHFAIKPDAAAWQPKKKIFFVVFVVFVFFMVAAVRVSGQGP